MRQLLLSAGTGAALGLLVASQVAGPLLAQERATDETFEALDLFGDIFERVRTGYVEEVDERELIESAINGMLTRLDPHSSYLPPDDAEDLRSQTRGEFGGLGIEVTLSEEGYVRVVSPIDDTPAAEAGMQPEDLITHVDGDSILGLTLNEAVDMMRGPVGSDIVITVVREGEPEPFDVTITRDTIRVRAVRGRVEGDAVIIDINTFNQQTTPNLEDTLAELVEELGGMDNVSGFVIDLRNNPGGLLTEAVSVADAFLDAGEIVSTRGREEADSDRYNATEGDLAEGKPIVVLINAGSASASEIVAGALQDHVRAIIVGTRSFGKGSVQTIMPLQGDNGAIRLTTSRYYTPSGRSIQALGVSPDIVVENQPPVEAAAEEEETEAQRRRSEADLRGSLENDSLTEDERRLLEEEAAAAEAAARRRSEDYQMAYALDILKGLAVLADR